MRKIENSHQDRSRAINRLRESIMTFKTDSIHRQKQIDHSKLMVEQKRLLLQKIESENQLSITKKEECIRVINDAKIELEKIGKQTSSSVDLKA